MKSALKVSVAALILATAAAGAFARQAQTRQHTFEVPKELSVRFELQDAPELEAPGSWWELSVELGVEEQDKYMRWLADHRGGPAGLTRPGYVLIKKSFANRDLSKKQGRAVEVTVPVGKELLERFQHIKSSPQMVWLNCSARVHAGKSDEDVVNDGITPTWDLRYFIDKGVTIKLELKNSRRLTWSYGGQKMRPTSE
ncbi:MAG TPA: hypothetical protein VF736_10110 [Pyrinomonadaceae bacterium]|jgi:hypothetical protein